MKKSLKYEKSGKNSGKNRNNHKQKYNLKFSKSGKNPEKSGIRIKNSVRKPGTSLRIYKPYFKHFYARGLKYQMIFQIIKMAVLSLQLDESAYITYEKQHSAMQNATVSMSNELIIEIIAKHDLKVKSYNIAKIHQFFKDGQKDHDFVIPIIKFCDRGSQYKSDSIDYRNLLVLKLPRFSRAFPALFHFPHLPQ